jgi:site-specific recombinase XerC
VTSLSVGRSAWQQNAWRTRRLTEITPSKIAGLVAWLCDERAQKRSLSDATVRNIMAPLRACMTTAVREGLIRSNPARDVDLPLRPTAEDMEDDEAKAMSRDELAEMQPLSRPVASVLLVPGRHGRSHQRGHRAPVAASGT